MNRQLDKRVARILYGDSIAFKPHGDRILMGTDKKMISKSLECGWLGCEDLTKNNPLFCLFLPEWSANIECAWMLVERMMDKCVEFRIEAYIRGWVIRYEMLDKLPCNAVYDKDVCAAIVKCFIAIFES